MVRKSIRDGKLLYHFTAIDNIHGIFSEGLKPRNELNNFKNVADASILGGRRERALDSMVPFHFFVKTPFDYSVVNSNPTIEFVYITVRRSLAEHYNWSISTRHPLSRGASKLLPYQDGMAAIDWDLMDSRDWDSNEWKQVSMAECLSPATLPTSDFFKIYVRTDACKSYIDGLAEKFGLTIDVEVNSLMFCAAAQTA
ncbi:DarT ssDNA thymidine ADP-ribosyltransferase family protein [Grimontia sp. NTOU-MAR1]|uniref:DarT ssDNA thymidine ADP-ribosyltransferase family protein n=1 Tax=Grimontia sp. NTOU-MAR1 TaxID=3111011 RepID=UPI002DB7DFCD|nr:DarT ssDNA thymidine ADP-ribosyltransferase family protein [Grimontia sp. NTOU-MAR1]WRV96256.1 DarT ssDNA thymidine ADP-ribosyltransferase family protein [Grimontia sp. NTOU-MAR1]